MRTSRPLASRAFVVVASALLPAIAACGPSEDVNPLTAEHPQFAPLEQLAPERPVAPSAAPPKVEAARVEVPAVPPERGPERVRLLTQGRLVEKPTRFAAEVAKAEPNRLTLADEHVVGYRLPRSHELALEPGDRVIVRYTPTSLAGSDEVSLTVYDAPVSASKQEREAKKQPADGPIRLQVVQRGAAEPVRIDERGFSVRQSHGKRVVLETDLDRTSEVPVTVVVGDKIFVPERGRPSDFDVDDRTHRITVLRSHHVEHRPSNLSEEGPPYYLEYVLTRVKRSQPAGGRSGT